MRCARYASAVSAAAVVSCVVAVFAIAPAKAGDFEFSFGAPSCANEPTSPCVLGEFATGGAANDPGFELITGLHFNLLQGTAENGDFFSYADLRAEEFQAGAAFNPTTDAFINSGEVPADNIGDLQVPFAGGEFFIDGGSFAQSSGSFSGFFATADGPKPFKIEAPLVITRETAATVPEASTWVMLLLGFGGLGLAASRRLLGAALWPKLET
ncbi:MAG TPA: PEP-CTERM sorting domain-containing protein [Roseiarcus sp.]